MREPLFWAEEKAPNEARCLFDILLLIKTIQDKVLNRQVPSGTFKYRGWQKLSDPVYSGLYEWEVVGFLFDGDDVEAF
jgi:hypothetical protein